MSPIPMPVRRPFELPAQVELWFESVPSFGHLQIFRAHLSCEGMIRTLESKAFNPRNPEEAATAWLEFMSLTGNILITSIMPPDMLTRFQPLLGGGMQLRKSTMMDGLEDGA